MAATVLTTSRVLPRLLISRGRGSGPDPSQLTPPDSAFAKEVVEACADLGPMVIEHGYRSYLFGRALGVAEGIECDEEALFAATMFHDYAFEAIESLTDCCFTLAGAEVAAEFLERSPLSDELRHDVLDAITLHLNPSVGPEKPLQRLAHDGIALDVLGMRGWELDPSGIARGRRSPPAARIHRRRRGAAARPRAARPRLPLRRPLQRRLRRGTEAEPMARGRRLIADSPQVADAYGLTACEEEGK